MKNIQKYLAAFAIALLSGLGIFSVVTAINAQNTNPQETEQTKKEPMNKTDSSETEDSDVEDGDEAEENESEEGEESEQDDQSDQAALQKEAAIDRAQAEAIALGSVSGIIVEGELEKENGRLIYSFDIKNADNKMFDVEVDATKGEIVKAQPDDENGENEENESDSK